MSGSLQPHGLQHARPACPSPTLRVYSNSCPLSQWYHATISSSVIPFSSCPQSIPALEFFSSESALLIRWPKYWNFSFNISPSSEYAGLISFRMDWLDLLSIQGTLKTLQHHISKASILQHSTFFIVQLSHPYMTAGKTIALTRHTFVGKVMSLLFNMLPRLAYLSSFQIYLQYILNYNHHCIYHILQTYSFCNWKLYFLTTSIHFPYPPPPTPGNHQFILCFCEVFFFLKDSRCKWDHKIFAFSSVWFVALSIMPSGFIYVVANGRVFFFIAV